MASAPDKKADDLEMQKSLIGLGEGAMEDDSMWLHCLVFPRVMEDEDISDPKTKLRRAFSRRAIANWESSSDPLDIALWKKLETDKTMKKEEFHDHVFNRAIKLLEKSGVQIGIRGSVDADELFVLLDINTDDPKDTTLESIAEAVEATVPISKAAYYFKNVPVPQLGKTWSQKLFGFDKLASRDAMMQCEFTRSRKQDFRHNRDRLLEEAKKEMDKLKLSGDVEALKGTITHHLNTVPYMTTLADYIKQAALAAGIITEHERVAADELSEAHHKRSAELGTVPGLSEADIKELLEISELPDSGMAKLSGEKRSRTEEVKKLLEYFTKLSDIILARDKERRRSKNDWEHEENMKTPRDLLKFRLDKWSKWPLEDLKKIELYEPFKSADILKIIRLHLHSILDVEAAQAAGIITDSFPLHERELVQELSEDWGALSCKSIVSLPREDHADKVRAYFGEKIAFFFSWLYFETRMLIFPVIFSLLGRLRYLPCFHGHSHIFEKVFPWGMVIWLSFMVSAFRQDSFKSNLTWGMTLKDTFGNKLSEFNEANRGGLKETLVRGFHWAMVAFFFSETIIAAYKINRYRAHAIEQRHAGHPEDLFLLGVAIPWEVIAQYGIVINIKVVTLLWTLLSPVIAHAENRRTDMVLEDSQVIKNFLVMSVVTYYPFIYLAFVKRYVVKDGCEISDAGRDSCLVEMSEQVIIFFITNIVIVFGMVALEVFLQKRQVQQDMANITHKDAKYSDSEAQSKRSVYASDFDDFLTLVIELGFVVMLSAPMPIMVVVIFLTNMLKLRIFAWRMLHAFQRAIPYGRHDIGQWRVVLQVLCFLSGVVALAMNLFAQSAGELNNPFDEFICLEHVVLLALFFLMQSIPVRALSEVTVLEQQADDFYRLMQFDDQEEEHSNASKAQVIRAFPGGAATPGSIPTEPLKPKEESSGCLAMCRGGKK